MPDKVHCLQIVMGHLTFSGLIIIANKLCNLELTEIQREYLIGDVGSDLTVVEIAHWDLVPPDPVLVPVPALVPVAVLGPFPVPVPVAVPAPALASLAALVGLAVVVGIPAFVLEFAPYPLASSR